MLVGYLCSCMQSRPTTSNCTTSVWIYFTPLEAWITWFDVFLSNIEVIHPGATQLLENGAISLARSQIPGNRCAVDKTMEETFMRFAKSSCGAGGAGLTGILENYGAYQRCIRTTSERTKYYQATLEMTGMSNDTDATRSGSPKSCGSCQTNTRELDINARLLIVLCGLGITLLPWKIPSFAF